MRFLIKMLAPIIFALAYGVFRSSFFKRSRKRHEWLMKIFRFCADNDHTKALSVYGHLLHFRGDGVENRIQGGIYLQRAADQGDMKAQYQVGRIFEEGFEHYFSANEEKALRYYQQAAEQGHSLAISRLIKVFSSGELGQPADAAKAEMWQRRQPALPTSP